MMLFGHTQAALQGISGHGHLGTSQIRRLSSFHAAVIESWETDKWWMREIYLARGSGDPGAWVWDRGWSPARSFPPAPAPEVCVQFPSRRHHPRKGVGGFIVITVRVLPLNTTSSQADFSIASTLHYSQTMDWGSKCGSTSGTKLNSYIHREKEIQKTWHSDNFSGLAKPHASSGEVKTVLLWV